MPVDPDVQTQLDRIDNLVYGVQQGLNALNDALIRFHAEFMRRHPVTSSVSVTDNDIQAAAGTIAAITAIHPGT